MQIEVKCTKCGKTCEDLLSFKCHICGNPLEIQPHSKFEKAKILRRKYSVWRYAKLFTYIKEKDIITLGEGWTPLVKFSRNVHFKLENLNPTGSFKDRGSTVLISTLHKLVKKAGGYISENSSGNAGASIAAYAALAGLKAKVYVPENVSGPKYNQIQFYGAEVVKVSGSRRQTAEEAQKPDNGKFYVGHILHPLFRDGIRSLSYEIAEQFTWHAPEHIYVPVSAGTLLLGMISGFKHLYTSGVIKCMPKIIACQTDQVSPLYHRLRKLCYTMPENLTSVADALVSVDPPLLENMVKSMKEVCGDVVMVKENEILGAFTELAKKGFFAEPSSAVAYAAYKRQLKNKEVSKGEGVLIILTGSGLKTTLKPI